MKFYFLLLAFATLLSNASSQFCRNPPTVRNAQLLRFNPLNGRFEPSSETRFRYWESVRYDCDGDFVLSGPSELTCYPNNSWAPSQPPACISAPSRSERLNNMEDEVCRQLPTIANGVCRPEAYVFNNGGEYNNGQYSRGKRATIGQRVACECDPGFTSSDLMRAVCLSTGEWSRTPRCTRDSTQQQQQCQTIPYIANGVCSLARSFFGSHLVAYQCSCQSGFTMKGAPDITCSPTTGQMSTFPTCERSQTNVGVCTESLIPLTNGICRAVVDGEYTNGLSRMLKYDLLRCTCGSGYQLVGNRDVFCRFTGWGTLPQCVPSGPTTRPPTTYCASPREVPYSTCFRASDSESESSVVVRDMSRGLDLATAVFRNGDKIRFYCNAGYEMNGPSIVSCLNDGTWSTMPECTRIVTCPPPPQVNGAGCNNCNNRNSFSFRPNDQVAYECRADYQIFGNPVITCQQNGQWSTPPQCILITTTTPAPKCSGTPQISNGYCNRLGRAWSEIYNVGDQILCQCFGGFQVQPSPVATCVANELWSTLPRCQRVTCKSPPQVANAGCDCPGSGSSAPVEFQVGDRIRYTCNNGYVANKLPLITCQSDGTWSEPPVCIRGTIG